MQHGNQQWVKEASLHVGEEAVRLDIFWNRCLWRGEADAFAPVIPMRHGGVIGTCRGSEPSAPAPSAISVCPDHLLRSSRRECRFDHEPPANTFATWLSPKPATADI